MPQPRADGLGPASEAELIRRAVCKDEAAIRAILQANNDRLYRIARSIVRDDGEAEDVLQEAYLRAFSALATFRGESSLATWLTRIVFNEALQRRRRKIDLPAAQIEAPPAPGAQIIDFPLSGQQSIDPERTMAQRELCRLLERAIDALPDEFRTVLVARVIEDMSIEETADLLGLQAGTVKTRLHRARRLLKAALAEHLGSLFSDVFPFAGQRCERMTSTVMERLKRLP
jgi:RNA polymerase sigma-70 factor (ECF subfamily)